MSQPAVSQRSPLSIKYLRPDEVRLHLSRDPRLIVPVGTTEHHGPHLPLGCDTIIVERLADDLSAEFQVLRAPTIEYGVNAATPEHYPGSAGVRRKTLHRLLNDLVGAWEASGVEEFIILTAHGQDPHQEALSTLRTRKARVRTVDVFSIYPEGDEPMEVPVHGGALDTSLLMYLQGDLVALERAQDYLPSRRIARRYFSGRRGAIPKDSPGSLGRPSQATAERGRQLYRFIYGKIAAALFSS
ncbi:MAG: creatinine amidohydrolase [Gemmatimonadales bacterium]|nr:Creatinine amidohydrolase [bacterium HR33]GIW51541.1 MAG: creatinine amidohydrolase [Gemmatimonadales bacterium]